MPVDITSLPPWAQVLYTVATVLGFAALGVWRYAKAKGAERDKAKAEAEEADHFDPAVILTAGPVLKFMLAIDDIAVNLKLQTEAQRNMSAVATAIGKRIEDDYDELRVFKAVRVALDEERRQRAAL